ncbi:GAF domain-containing protein [Halanaeroarchaeum sp. HSR-CO]|uniref:GAF domain-containing protein n=1 Tax=Halanaeroarchaeum sp. HSR-CO TaxID=2866382 RepID=UPI00217DCF41|nr:GAF domain-containing protein [Halanaeroarchaeum sp. HSR-CO]
MNRTWAASAGLALSGVGLVAVQLSRWPSSTLVEMFATLPFVWMALSLVYAGYWLSKSDRYGVYGQRVLVWTAGSALTFAAVAVLVVLAADSSSPFTSAFGPVADMLTAGALAGTLVGLYDAQSKDRLVALEAERDHVKQFADKAESLNHYGKALNQSQSLYEVSALSIEVLELLIGSRGSAVTYESDEDVTILDSTLASDAADVIEAAAHSLATRESLVAVRFPHDADLQIPDDLGIQEVIAVPIASANGGTLSLVAFLDGDDSYDREDLDLLESLSAHVGTALSRIDTSGIRTDA